MPILWYFFRYSFLAAHDGSQKIQMHPPRPLANGLASSIEGSRLQGAPTPDQPPFSGVGALCRRDLEKGIFVSLRDLRGLKV